MKERCRGTSYKMGQTRDYVSNIPGIIHVIFQTFTKDPIPAAIDSLPHTGRKIVNSHYYPDEAQRQSIGDRGRHWRDDAATDAFSGSNHSIDGKHVCRTTHR